MDKVIRRIPVINIALGALVFIIFGLSNPLGTSIILGLLMLSIFAVMYRIRIDDYQKNFSSKGFLVVALTIIPALTCGFYYGLSYIFLN